MGLTYFVIFFRYIFGGLVLAVFAVSGIGLFWAAAIAWVIIGAFAILIYSVRSRGKTRNWRRRRDRLREREQLYSTFLSEHPGCSALRPKERHEAFRKWSISQGLSISGAEENTGSPEPSEVVY
ncbi:MAG: hypothetical protein ACR2RV_24630 [Verrucomicrobiales bacterium]